MGEGAWGEREIGGNITVRKTFSFSAGFVLFLDNKQVEAVGRFSLIVDIKRREREREREGEREGGAYSIT